MVKTRSSTRVRARPPTTASSQHEETSESSTRVTKNGHRSQKSTNSNSSSSRTGQNQGSGGGNPGNQGNAGGGVGQGGRDPLAPQSARPPAVYPHQAHQQYSQDSRVVMPVAPRQNSLYAAAAANMYGYSSAIVPQNNMSHIPIHPDVRFKRLPFYDILAEIMKPSSLVPVSSQRMQEASFYFHLTPQQATDIACGKDIVGAGNKLENIVQVQLRFCLLETSCEQEDYFPPSVAVKINNKMCQLPNPIPTNKPGVEPKRPPRPVNITALVKLSPTVANTITVAWAADFARGYVLSVFLVKKLTSNELLTRLKNKGTKNADYTRALIKEKLSEDFDNEVATTSLRVSLMCPLGKMRMIVPCRPASCPHLQCFDASLFLQMNERKPGWMCPVCDRPSPYDSLTVDGYFQDVLSSGKLPNDCTEIQLLQDGSWTPQNAPARPATAVQPVTLISDDLEVIPLDSGSSCSSSSGPAVKRQASGEDRKVNDVMCVDLTSDSEDDLPLKRKEPTSQHSSMPDVKSMPVISADTSEPVISLDSPSPPAAPASPAPEEHPAPLEQSDAAPWAPSENPFPPDGAQPEEPRETQIAPPSAESEVTPDEAAVPKS